jgi:hypothetical protein
MCCINRLLAGVLRCRENAVGSCAKVLVGVFVLPSAFCSVAFLLKLILM